MCSRDPTAVSRPHVVLVSLDTLRADQLRAYERTAPPHPALDGLSDRGHTFARAYSTAPWTLPAHVSLFTGLYPDRHGVVDPSFAIGNVPSFVEALHTHGYETVAFTDGGYVGPQYGFTRGFEIYDGWRNGNNDVPPSALPREGKRATDTRAAVFARASAFLEARKDSRPLFLFAHTYAVHDYFREWQAAKEGERRGPTKASAAKLACLLGKRECTPAEWRALEADYVRGVGDVDQALSALLALIDETLGLDRTIIVVVSDHGEGFDGEHGRIHHGGRLHHRQLHVPLIIAGPGVVRGRSNALVSLVDVGPTILALAGLPPDAQLDGRSLAPALFGERLRDTREAAWAAEYSYYWEDGTRRSVAEPPAEPLMTARIDHQHWAIETSRGRKVYAADDRDQLHPLPADAYVLPPDPRADVAPAKPARVRETMEVIEQLRALGYIE